MTEEQALAVARVMCEIANIPVNDPIARALLTSRTNLDDVRGRAITIVNALCDKILRYQFEHGAQGEDEE